MDIQLPFLFSATINASQKGKVSEMIETKAEISKNLEKALQELQRAKQHVANEKKKQNEKQRKAWKPFPHNSLSQTPKMKARTIRNDKSRESEKSR